jgi:hypothetical protein
LKGWSGGGGVRRGAVAYRHRCTRASMSRRVFTRGDHANARDPVGSEARPLQ